MRNLILLGLLCALAFVSCEKEGGLPPADCDLLNFKYYNDAEYDLGNVSDLYLMLACDGDASTQQIEDLVASMSFFDQDYTYEIREDENYPFQYMALKFDERKSCEQIVLAKAALEEQEIVSYVHHSFETDDCMSPIWEPLGELCVNTYSSLFYVKVMDQHDLADLYDNISYANCEFVSQNSFMPQWFTVRATKDSNGDALKLANLFYESGQFLAAEPDIITLPVE